MKQKWVLWALFGSLFVAACIKQKQEQEALAPEAPPTLTDEQEDSLLAEADTLLLDEELADEPLPTSADELFDDFLFLFDHSNRFQRHRVRFPLPVTEANGDRHEIERRQWQHHSMSLGQDFCTVLWNGHRQMEMSNEMQNEARVEHIYLHSRLVEIFDFERDSLNGQWMLTAQRSVPLDDYELTNFIDFYREFATDSVFQRRHVHDPLRFSMASEDTEEGMVQGTIDVDQWFEFAPEMPQAVLVNINYGQQYHNPNRVVMQMRGFSDSMQNLFVFRRDGGGRWRLTEFEN
ncbi:MAG: DUF4348 domain-containing protein [Bacteroidaceae bacterium]|nr:DUF4348 domain-containing protein [Bacteroidaceae bacterium]